MNLSTHWHEELKYWAFWSRNKIPPFNYFSMLVNQTSRNMRPRGHMAHLSNNSHTWSEKLKTVFRVSNTKYLDNLEEYILFQNLKIFFTNVQFNIKLHLKFWKFQLLRIRFLTFFYIYSYVKQSSLMMLHRKFQLF